MSAFYLPPIGLPNSPLPQLKQLAIMEPPSNIHPTSILMSPPGATPLDSFMRSPNMSHKFARPLVPGHRFPLSPPISPDCKVETADDLSTRSIRDPILYPHADPQSPQAPLFENANLAVQSQVVDEHMAARLPSLFDKSAPPHRRNYQLILEFKSQVMHRFNADRMAWYRREMAFLAEDRRLQNGGRRYTHIAPATSRSHRAPISRIVKSSTVKTKTPSRISKPKPLVREGSPDSKRLVREDRDFTVLVDLSPPLTSLPGRSNSMKVDWKGAPISLNDDPHVHLLHPDEVLLAANLRLDCATYLTSKRRIFIRRLECFNIGKEFRKTDAQQACKIDVNKASKLWQAFEKVGWLDERWVKDRA